MKYCSKCGTLCQDTDQFCKGCGYKFTSRATNIASMASDEMKLVCPTPDHYKKKSTSTASHKPASEKQNSGNHSKKQHVAQKQHNPASVKRNKISAADVFIIIISIIAGILILLVMIFVSEAGIIPAGLIAASWAALVRMIENKKS